MRLGLASVALILASTEAAQHWATRRKCRAVERTRPLCENPYGTVPEWRVRLACPEARCP